MIQKREYYGFRLKQRKDPGTVSFFVFTSDPGDIAEWSYADSLTEGKAGLRRRISEARLRAIRRFFSLDPVNIIPTSIVLAFQPGTAVFKPFSREKVENMRVEPGKLLNDFCEWGALSFEFDSEKPEKERPAFVVDGQHRLLGMAGVEDENLPVLVSALIGAGPDEQAFQFIVINNKTAKVPDDLVRLLIDSDKNTLGKRLETARISLQIRDVMLGIADDEEESPFYQMVDRGQRSGEDASCIKPGAIGHSLKYIRRRFPAFDEDKDALTDFFFAVWHGVKAAYPPLWERTGNHLFENAGFKAFSEYLTDAVEMLTGMADYFYADIYDPESVTNACKTVASQIDIRFWQAEWRLKNLDTSAGRDIIKDDLKRIRQNRKERKEWSESLSLVELHG